MLDTILLVCEEMFELASSDIFGLRHPDHACSQGLGAIAQHWSKIYESGKV